MAGHDRIRDGPARQRPGPDHRRRGSRGWLAVTPEGAWGPRTSVSIDACLWTKVASGAFIRNSRVESKPAVSGGRRRVILRRIWQVPEGVHGVAANGGGGGRDAGAGRGRGAARRGSRGSGGPAHRASARVQPVSV